jgi:hypothetical protein
MASLVSILSDNGSNVRGYYDAIISAAGASQFFWDDTLNAWVATGFRECGSLLSGHLLIRNRLSLPRLPGYEDLVECAGHILKSQMMLSDGYMFDARRRFWSQKLSEKCAEIDLAAMAGDALESFCAAGGDVYTGLLQPYVSRAVCARIGLDDDQRSATYPLILQYVRFLDGKLRDDSELPVALYAIVSLYAELARRISSVPSIYDTVASFASDLMLCVVAGHESTAFLLATVLLNAQEGGDLQRAGMDRELLVAILHEGLRFDSPVQLMGRSVASDCEFAGQRLRAGEKVFLHLGAANRDHRVFISPHSFDSLRDCRRHIAFGAAESRCIGVSLSLEISLALLSELAKRRQRIELWPDRMVWDNGLAGRGIKSLPGVLEVRP